MSTHSVRQLLPAPALPQCETLAPTSAEPCPASLHASCDSCCRYPSGAQYAHPRRKAQASPTASPSEISAADQPATRMSASVCCRRKRRCAPFPLQQQSSAPVPENALPLRRRAHRARHTRGIQLILFLPCVYQSLKSAIVPAPAIAPNEPIGGLRTPGATGVVRKIARLRLRP